MIIVAAVSSVAVTATGVAAGAPTPALLRGIIYATATSVVSVIAAMLFLPWAERLTGHETHLTLLEWGDLHHPLLQRLSLEAPGTYAHTIAIANLAEAACRGIGANPILGRVGAYYHDIGKLAQAAVLRRESGARAQSARSAQAGHERVDHPQSRARGTRARARKSASRRRSARSSPSTTARRRSPTSWSGRASAMDTSPTPDEYAYPGPMPQSARDRDRDAGRWRGGGGATC